MTSTQQPHHHSTPVRRLLRLRQIIGDPKADPPIPALLPISRSAFYAGIKSGLYPPPQKLGVRTAVWDSWQIMALVEGRDWRQVPKQA